MENEENVQPSAQVDETERTVTDAADGPETAKEMDERETDKDTVTNTSVNDGIDNINKETDKSSQTDTSNVQIDFLTRELKSAKSEVSLLKKRNARLESDIGQIGELLKSSNIDIIEVDGEKVPIDEFVAKAKEQVGRNHQRIGCVTEHAEQEGSESTCETEDTDTTGDIRPHQTRDNKSQIETLKTDMEVLRGTLHEAYEREQHYKTLVEQLDTAEAKAQQKWSSFHNGVIEQWSNHCNFLQRQLAAVAVKLKQVPSDQARGDGSEGSLTSSSLDNLEYNYNDDNQQQQHQQGLQQQQVAVPVAIPEQEIETTSVTNPQGIPTMITTSVPAQQIPVSYGRQPNLPPPWFAQDNRSVSYNIPPHHQYIHPSVGYSLQDPNACSGRMSSARLLHQYFTNLAMIEQAQREGRAYPQRRVYDEDDDDDENFRDDNSGDDVIPVAHAPRRARAYGPGFSSDTHDEQEYRQEESDAKYHSLSDHNVAASYNSNLTPTADPFVPESASIII